MTKIKSIEVMGCGQDDGYFFSTDDKYKGYSCFVHEIRMVNIPVAFDAQGKPTAFTAMYECIEDPDQCVKGRINAAAPTLVVLYEY